MSAPPSTLERVTLPAAGGGGGGGAPAAHHATHETGGTDAITLAQSQVTGLAISLAGKVDTSDARLTDARTPLAHAASHASGGTDAITLAQSQVTGLTTALAGKADLAGAAFTGAITITRATAGAAGLSLNVTGDTQQRLTAAADGTLLWGSGSAGGDANLYRSAAATLATDNALSVGGALGIRNISTDITNTNAIANFNNSNNAWPTGVASIYGIVGQLVSKDATATAMTGVRFGLVSSTANTLATTRTLQVQTPGVSGGSTIADNRGIYVAAQNVGTVSVGIAVDTATTAALWLGAESNGTGVGGGITFGSSRDTSLYRSAAGTLTTNGALVAGGALTSGTTPATTGQVRIPNNAWVTARNAGNTADVNLLSLNASNLLRCAAGATGWTAPTGGLARTTFVSDSATLTQVSQRLAALITDIMATGLLGA